jgi:hypothetical protein
MVQKVSIRDTKRVEVEEEEFMSAVYSGEDM